MENFERGIIFFFFENAKKYGFRRYLQILGSLRSGPHFFCAVLGGEFTVSKNQIRQKSLTFIENYASFIYFFFQLKHFKNH